MEMPHSPMEMPHSPVEMPHSRLGIAAFVVAMVGFIGTFAMVGIAGYLEVTTPGGIDEESPAAAMAGLGIIGGLLLEVVALVLGIAALFEANRKKVFAILGIAIPAATVVAVVFLLILGSAAE
jgi:hypothetical protein